MATKFKSVEESPTGGMRTLTVKQVGELLQLHPRTVWRLAAAGQIPKPIRIGGKSKRWRATDIERFLAIQ